MKLRCNLVTSLIIRTMHVKSELVHPNCKMVRQQTWEPKEERTVARYDSATMRALALRLNRVSLISLSTSSINLSFDSVANFSVTTIRGTYWIIKSTSLCFNIVSA